MITIDFFSQNPESATFPYLNYATAKALQYLISEGTLKKNLDCYISESNSA